MTATTGAPDPARPTASAAAAGRLVHVAAFKNVRSVVGGDVRNFVETLDDASPSASCSRLLTTGR